MKTKLSLAIAFYFLYSGQSFAQSVLATGNWFKLSVSQEGIYCITHSDLVSLGINPSAIDPRNISIYGNKAGMLPSQNWLPHADDLQEMAISVKGESDGVFDPTDTIFFYGQSSVQRLVDVNTNRFYHRQNLYSDSVCYFLTIKNTNGKRIQTRSSLPTFTNSINTYSDFEYHELDSVNFLHSGTAWYGEQVGTQNARTFNFDLTNISSTDTLFFKTEYGGRSVLANSTVGIQFNIANQSDAFSIVGTSPQDSYLIPRTKLVNYAPPLNVGPFLFSLSSADPNSLMWIDYIELNFSRQLKIFKPQQIISDLKSISPGASTKYTIDNASPDSKVWDVSDPINVVDQQFTVNLQSIEFNAANDTLHAYLAFDGTTFLQPVLLGQIPNQNLHAISQANMIIVTDKAYLNEANTLANFHQTHDGLTTIVANVDEIYNEYSTGVQDVTGIRDFVRQIFNRSATANDSLKYLLLFGDGSYDYKGHLGQKSSFVPVFESANSINLTQTYFNEFYYADLGDSSGGAFQIIPLISVGRLPVKNSNDAQVVNKIINYSLPPTLGPWRTKYIAVSDDGDHETHSKQNDTLANRLENRVCELNIDKIYFDSYVQITNSSGEYYPGVESDLQKVINDGSLIIHYIGHGGDSIWGNENVLDYNFISSAINSNLPLFITATTMYNRMDDPSIVSGGEALSLNPTGAGIGCMGIGRLAFSSSNFNIAQKIGGYLFEKENNNYLSIGDIFKKAKQDYSLDPYVSSFCLLGDPAVRLNIPKFEVVTTNFNGHPVSSNPDTLIPGQSLQISGEIHDNNGNVMTSFNGLLNMAIYDQKTQHITLANDPGSSPQTFYEWDDTLRSDTIPVVNGIFNTTVILPWALDSGSGQGRISFYAQNGIDDGWGCYQNFVYRNLHAGIEEFPDVRIDVYPNPSSNFIEFSITGIEVHDFDFSLIDIQSRLIKKSNLNKNKFILEKAGLAAGVYYYEISDEKKKFLRRGRIIFEN